MAGTCPHFGVCGGCRYLDMGYEAQLAHKEAQVRGLLAQGIADARKYTDAEDIAALAGLEWFTGILPSPRAFGYRNKMEFSFGDTCKDGPLALGMHRKGSFYDIVTTDGCRIVDADFRAILSAALAWAQNEGLRHYHKKRHDGYLRHLLVRKALHTGEILVDLITSGTEQHDLSGLVTALLSLPLEGRIIGVLHTVNDALADVIRDEGTEVLYGRASFEEELLGLRFTITPFSFFQTNSFGAEVLYETARAYIRDLGGHYPVIYDLYCGTGTITQLMAPAADRAIGVEIVPEAVEAARMNAVTNGLGNCEFICGDVLKALDGISARPDLIILDPPREGIHPKALPRILGYGVKHILYISCKPKSFAGEFPSFLAAGYRPVRGCCVDEFPWTDNVECCVLLERV